MKNITRKQFINMSIASTLGVPFIGLNNNEYSTNVFTKIESDTNTKRYIDDIGFQVYTLRHLLVNNSVSLFKSLADVGIKTIEFFEPEKLHEYVPIVKDNGMIPLATHFMPGYITGNWERAKMMGMPPPPDYHFENILEDCNKHGIKYAGIAIMLEIETLDHFKRFADQVIIRAEQSKSTGIQLYYHNHNFEFQPMEGAIPYEVMRSIFDPDLVKLEFDVFWATVAGLDPIQYLQKIGDQLLFLHMKDLKKGTKVGSFDLEFSQENPFVELGTGMLDWESILQETRKLGVRYAFLDQDETEMEDKIESVRLNVDYVKKLNI